MKVWKFPLGIGRGHYPVVMPQGAMTLDAQWQDSVIALWAMVEPTTKNETLRRFVVAFTGEEIAFDKVEYIATIQGKAGLVYHVLEVLD